MGKPKLKDRVSDCIVKICGNMNPTEALNELKQGRCVTSSYHYGHFRIFSDNVIRYFCKDSGCDFCKQTYTEEEFLLLDCDFETI